mgnify:CR=1 FL=1
MGSFLKLVIASGLFLFASASFAADCIPTEVKIKEIPFPKGTEIEFPWDSIQGEWHTNTSAFVIVRGAEDSSGRRYLKIEQRDKDTAEVNAGGVAVLRKGSRIASGLLTEGSKETYVFLRSFRDKNAKGVPNGKSVLVITIRNLESHTETCDETHQKLLKGAL